jgi:hypothetical protein
MNRKLSGFIQNASPDQLREACDGTNKRKHAEREARFQAIDRAEQAERTSPHNLHWNTLGPNARQYARRKYQYGGQYETVAHWAYAHRDEIPNG